MIFGNNQTRRKLSFIKPFQFRPNQSSETNLNENFDRSLRKTSFSKPSESKNPQISDFSSHEVLLSSSYYSHEGGDKYLQIQEMEYLIKNKFQHYSFWIWVHLVSLVSLKE